MSDSLIDPDAILNDPQISLFAQDVKEQFSRVRDKFSESRSILDFIPSQYHSGIRDGTSTYDCSPIFATAIAACVADNTRDLVLPAGTFWLYSASPTNSFYGIDIRDISNFRIRGAGYNSTTIKVGPNVNIGTMALSNLSFVEVSDLCLDGNRVNQTSPIGHGLRGQVLDNFSLRRVIITNTAGYGIGFQADNDDVSSFTRMLLEDVKILEPGNDGIDFKNKGSLNTQNRWVRVHIRNPSRTAPATGNAAFDIRGPVDLHQCIAEFTVEDEVGDTQTGFRVRNTSEVNGIGGQNTSFSQCRVIAPVGGTNTVIGWGVADPYCSLESCVVENVDTYGFGLGSTNIVGTNLRAINCNTGFRINGTDTKLVNPVALDCSNYAFQCDGDIDTLVVGASAIGCGTGFRFEGGSTRAVVIHPTFTDLSVGPFSGASTDQQIIAKDYTGDRDFYVGGYKGLQLYNRGVATDNYIQVRPNAGAAIVSMIVEGSDDYPDVPVGIQAKGTSYVQLGNESVAPILRARQFGTPTTRVDVTAGTTIGPTSASIAAQPESGSDATMAVYGAGAGGIVLGRDVDKVGFYGFTGTTKPTITGVRASNTALADLLTKLSGLGILTDSTTAT